MAGKDGTMMFSDDELRIHCEKDCLILIFVNTHFERYIEKSCQVMSILKEYEHIPYLNVQRLK